MGFFSLYGSCYMLMLIVSFSVSFIFLDYDSWFMILDIYKYIWMGESAPVSEPKSDVRRSARGGRKPIPWLGVASCEPTPWLGLARGKGLSLHCESMEGLWLQGEAASLVGLLQIGAKDHTVPCISNFRCGDLSVPLVSAWQALVLLESWIGLESSEFWF